MSKATEDFFMYIARRLTEEDRKRMDYVAEVLAKKFGLKKEDVRETIDDAIIDYIVKETKEKSETSKP